MNKTIAKILVSGLAMTMFGTFAVSASASVPGVTVREAGMTREADNMVVNMLLDLNELKVKSNRAVLLTPVIINGADSVCLPSVGVYGRTRYYQYQRESGNGMISGSDETFFKASSRPETLEYNHSVAYAGWMNGADLVLRRSDYGCCHTLLASTAAPLDKYAEVEEVFVPQLVYAVPTTRAEKTRAIEGSAFIEFPVNISEIRPNFRDNAAELRKITASIDTVKTDRDATVTSVWLKGYASPEGSWANNTRLAKGRTASVKDYVDALYNLPEGVMKTEYDPEDWNGLRRYVESSDMANKIGILSIIDSNLDPDVKDARIRATYPKDYAFLLANVYPSLRHTDYRIAYTLRHYSDVSEIRRVMQERPQNLDLDEFYLLAAEYEPGTPEFTEVYETAVRMYPTDPMANLNAANAAICRGDYDAAEKYLTRSGETPEATYARGVIAFHKGNVSEAETLLQKAKSAGVTQASELLEKIQRINQK